MNQIWRSFFDFVCTEFDLYAAPSAVRQFDDRIHLIAGVILIMISLRQW